MNESTRLIPRFYIGSAPTRSRDFTYIVLCAVEWQPTSAMLAPAKIRRTPLDDGPEPLEPIQSVLDAHAARIARAWTRGERVLVSCFAGRNRSALVSALALSQITGDHPSETGAFIQQVRVDPNGYHALSNEVFWDFLQNYEPSGIGYSSSSVGKRI